MAANGREKRKRKALPKMLLAFEGCVGGARCITADRVTSRDYFGIITFGAFWNALPCSNMLRIVVVFLRVAGILPLEIDFVLFDVGVEDIVGAHAQHLRHADKEMKQVHDFYAGVLLVELLVFGPPFPWHAVREFSHFLGHGAAIVEDPLGLFLLGHDVGVDADALVERVLHAKEFTELIRIFHARKITVQG